MPARISRIAWLTVIMLASSSSWHALAEDSVASKAIERIDRQVLAFVKNFEGETIQIAAALVSDKDTEQRLNLTDAEWSALAAKVDGDLAALPKRAADTIQGSVFTFDFTSLPAGSPFTWKEMREEQLILMRGYDTQAIARMGFTVALSSHLSSPEQFGRETLMAGFTSAEFFMTTVGDREALGSAQGNWITTTTFVRTPKGLIKPETIRLHPRY